jgi:hypothetical protein
MAEREGFEPSNEVDPRYAISSRARSTAPAPLRDSDAHLAGVRPAKGYDTGPSSVARLPPVLIAASEAFAKTFGIIATFGGIGLIVNAILIYIAIQVRGERRQNEEYLSSRGPNDD